MQNATTQLTVRVVTILPRRTLSMASFSLRRRISCRARLRCTSSSALVSLVIR